MAHLLHLGAVRVVVLDLEALLAEQLDQPDGRALPQVVDVLLVGEPEDQNLGPLGWLPLLVQGFDGAVDHVVRHLPVDLARQLDETGVELELARLPRQVVRIDRDAVPAQAGARVEAHEAERLGLRRVDHFPDVDVHPLAEQLQLVDQGDVHAAEDVLQELGHLRLAGPLHRHDLGDGGGVQRRGKLRALPRIATHHFRDGGGVEARVSRVLALGREGEVEVEPGAQAGKLLDDGLHHFLGGAGIGGALQHDQLAGADVRPDRARRVLDVRHVRLARLAEVHRGREALVLARVLLLDPAAVDVADVALALPQRGDLALVDVEPDDRKALLSEGERERKPYVTQPANSHYRPTRLDLVEQRRLCDLQHCEGPPS